MGEVEKINLVLKYLKVGIRDGFSEKLVGRGYCQSGGFRPKAVIVTFRCYGCNGLIAAGLVMCKLPPENGKLRFQFAGFCL